MIFFHQFKKTLFNQFLDLDCFNKNSGILFNISISVGIEKCKVSSIINFQSFIIQARIIVKCGRSWCLCTYMLKKFRVIIWKMLVRFNPFSWSLTHITFHYYCLYGVCSLNGNSFIQLVKLSSLPFLLLLLSRMNDEKSTPSEWLI